MYFSNKEKFTNWKFNNFSYYLSLSLIINSLNIVTEIDLIIIKENEILSSKLVYYPFSSKN